MAVELALAGGQLVVVRGSYEDVEAQLAARQLTTDDGNRQLIDINGDPVTVQRGAVVLRRPRRERRTRAVGFAQALEAA